MILNNRKLYHIHVLIISLNNKLSVDHITNKNVKTKCPIIIHFYNSIFKNKNWFSLKVQLFENEDHNLVGFSRLTFFEEFYVTIHLITFRSQIWNENTRNKSTICCFVQSIHTHVCTHVATLPIHNAGW